MEEATALAHQVISGEISVDEAAKVSGLPKTKVLELVAIAKESAFVSARVKEHNKIRPKGNKTLGLGSTVITQSVTKVAKPSEIVARSIYQVLELSDAARGDPSLFLETQRVLQGWIKLAIQTMGLDENDVIKFTEVVDKVIQFVYTVEDEYPGITRRFEEYAGEIFA